jgi:hypothetical protein
VQEMERKQGHAPDTKRFVSRGTSREVSLHKQQLVLPAMVHANRCDPAMEVLQGHWPLLLAMGGVPSPFPEQAFEILTSGSHQRFTIHAPESSKAKSPYAMPLLPSANNGSTQTLRLRMAF